MVVSVGNGQLNQISMSEQCNTLDTMHDKQMIMRGGQEMKTTVRRLTPIECERLQGFPDGWCDIGDWVGSNGKQRKESDTQKYKALGNSIAMPFWSWLARRIAAQYEKPVTIGSLFSGIGGFELAFVKTGGIPVWASEIEEYPMAVTRKHFGYGEIKGDVWKYLNP